MFFVGDAAQTIYTFRGAKSANLLNLPDCMDFGLTESFRFDPNIAVIANLIVWGKKESLLEFRPYQRVGASPRASQVWCAQRTKKDKGGLENDVMSFIERCQRDETAGAERCVTLISCMNMTLVIMAIRLLRVSLGIKIAVARSDHSESSGKGKYKKVSEEIEHVYDLFSKQTKTLPKSFKEFTGATGKPLPFEDGFDGFVSECDERELTKCVLHIAIVTAYEDDTMGVVSVFQNDVLNANINAANANVLLTTIHKTKGAEWANVLVIDDVPPLAAFEVSLPEPPIWNSLSPPPTTDDLAAHFCWKSWGDDFNTWYVAVTRAKARLVVPRAILAVVEAFESSARIAAAELDGEHLLLPYGDADEDERAYTSRVEACNSTPDRYGKLKKQIFGLEEDVLINEVGKGCSRGRAPYGVNWFLTNSRRFVAYLHTCTVTR